MKATGLKPGRQVRTFSKNEALVAAHRKQIVQCALRVFANKGYNGVTMREVAKACNMGFSGIYHYVGSKQDILHLIAQQLPVLEAEIVEKLRKEYAEEQAELILNAIRADKTEKVLL